VYRPARYPDTAELGSGEGRGAPFPDRGEGEVAGDEEEDRHHEDVGEHDRELEHPLGRVHGLRVVAVHQRGVLEDDEDDDEASHGVEKEEPRGFRVKGTRFHFSPR